jgi:hypothetical protein
LIEPASTSLNRVVIATTNLTTMAAGVRVRQTLTMAQLCGGAAACANVQLFDPPIGRAPAPCSVMGGFCLEPLIGTAGNPAPRPDSEGMLVGNGFVTYAERLPASTSPSPKRGIQLRLSDLGLLHSARAPELGARSTAAQINGGGIFSGQSFHRFVGATNDPLPPTNLFVSGDLIGSQWSALSTNAARAFRRDASSVSHRDVTTGNDRTPAVTVAAPNFPTFLGAERGTSGGMWFVETAPPFDMTQPGVRAGVLRRVGADGSITTSINDLSPPVLLLFDVGSGGGGFGQAGSGSATSTPSLFFANARRLIVSGFTGTNTPQQLYMADLTSATPTLARLNIPDPMPGANGAAFRSVVVDPSDKIWFVYGATFGMGLFVFDPANNSTRAVPLPGHGAVQVGFDGTHIIVFAQPTQGGPDRNIFRVRPFET